ncbi:hypothetical protein Tco_1126603 [Tanacetum coccineum]
MLGDIKIPLSKELLQRMLDFGLEVEVESTVALDLIRVDHPRATATGKGISKSDYCLDSLTTKLQSQLSWIVAEKKLQCYEKIKLLRRWILKIIRDQDPELEQSVLIHPPRIRRINWRNNEVKQVQQSC